MSFSISFNQTPVQSLGVGNQMCMCGNVYGRHNPNHQLDIKEVSKQFCDFYYSNTIKGLAGILSLFDQNAYCNYGGKECIGMYNVMVMMASDGISSLRYDNLNGVVLPIDDNTMSIQVIGLCQGVTFWNQLTAVKEFSETFILKLVDDKILVTSYNFRLM